MRIITSRYIILLAACLLLWSCSTTRHVPAGSMLLDNVHITVDDTSKVKSADLINYLRQTPNHKVLGFAKLQLGMYNLSGKDSTKWYNKWIRRLGQPPVIYNDELTAASRKQLRQALINKGYMGATVDVDTVIKSSGKKINVNYKVHPGSPHYIIDKLRYS